MNVEKTVHFELSNGKTIMVRDLDPRIQEHVEVLDRLREDVTQKAYELNVYQIALQTKATMIKNTLEGIYVTGDSGKETPESASNPAPPKSSTK